LVSKGKKKKGPVGQAPDEIFPQKRENCREEIPASKEKEKGERGGRPSSCSPAHLAMYRRASAGRKKKGTSPRSPEGKKEEEGGEEHNFATDRLMEKSSHCSKRKGAWHVKRKKGGGKERGAGRAFVRFGGKKTGPTCRKEGPLGLGQRGGGKGGKTQVGDRSTLSTAKGERKALRSQEKKKKEKEKLDKEKREGKGRGGNEESDEKSISTAIGGERKDRSDKKRGECMPESPEKKGKGGS